MLLSDNLIILLLNILNILYTNTIHWYMPEKENGNMLLIKINHLLLIQKILTGFSKLLDVYYGLADLLIILCLLLSTNLAANKLSQQRKLGKEYSNY